MALYKNIIIHHGYGYFGKKQDKSGERHSYFCLFTLTYKNNPAVLCLLISNGSLVEAEYYVTRSYQCQSILALQNIEGI